MYEEAILEDVHIFLTPLDRAFVDEESEWLDFPATHKSKRVFDAGSTLFVLSPCLSFDWKDW